MTAPNRRHRAGLHPVALRGIAVAVLAALAASAAPGAAFQARAQDSQMQALLDRMDRLQRELSTLQRQVYRGEPPPAAAAPSGGEAMPDTAAARLELRLSQFEQQLRSLTGQVEELSFRNKQMRDQLDRLTESTERRLQALEQTGPGTAPQTATRSAGSGALGATAESPPGVPSDAPTLGALAESQPRGAPSGGQGAAPGETRILGQVSQDQVEAMQSRGVQEGGAASSGASPSAAASSDAAGAQAPEQQAALVGATPEEQYKHAFSLLSQANYAEAERALSAFLAEHPDDPLAGNAKYWLGETCYVRQDYQRAAVTFAEAFQQYPESSKAPDNLLKLGMALSALGSKQ
ncbi:MAG TPA: tol-pal system protein YbgF, partial [Kiloniellales bacterium]|nr:tol-pal system protein YbgF [Kiloniellales bacterium]